MFGASLIVETFARTRNLFLKDADLPTPKTYYLNRNPITGPH